MIYLSQYDTRWKMTTIGNTKLTLGRYGCTVTCLSMLSDYFKSFQSPAVLAKNLQFTKEGLIIWQSLATTLPFKLLKRFYDWNISSIDSAIKDPKMACILQVNGFHWVVAVKRIPFTKHYIIVDPWGGKLSTTAKYGTITGGAVFIKS